MTPEPDIPDEALDRAAAEWLIKQDRGLTPAEQDAFLQWLSADPAHARRLARHRATWSEFNLLAQWRPEHSAEPNPDLLARPRRPRWIASVRWGTLAAAAACVLAWAVWPGHGGSRAANFPADYVATAYEQHTLQDGSVLEMRGGTRLSLRFTDAERRVELHHGEAQFTVARNPVRPFIVHAGGVDVRAVGTAFNVRLAASEVEVLVTEGKVSVSPQASATPSVPPPASAEIAATAVNAGQRTVVARAPTPEPPRVVPTSAEDMKRLLAWQPPLLDFDSTPLAAVVTEFNRHNRTRLVIADEALGSMPIVASFRADNLEGFVRLLQIGGDVRVERGNGVILLRKAR